MVSFSHYYAMVLLVLLLCIVYISNEFSVLEHRAVVVVSVYISNEFSVLEHRAVVVKAQEKLRKHGAKPKEARGSSRADGHQKQTCSHKSSGWKDILPIAHYQFDLSAVEFRDALAMSIAGPC